MNKEVIWAFLQKSFTKIIIKRWNSLTKYGYSEERIRIK